MKKKEKEKKMKRRNSPNERTKLKNHKVLTRRPQTHPTSSTPKRLVSSFKKPRLQTHLLPRVLLQSLAYARAFNHQEHKRLRPKQSHRNRLLTPLPLTARNMLPDPSILSSLNRHLRLSSRNLIIRVLLLTFKMAPRPQRLVFVVGDRSHRRVMVPCSGKQCKLFKLYHLQCPKRNSACPMEC